MRILFVISIFLGTFFTYSNAAYAESFTIHQRMGFDSVPPTVPTGVTTTPVATTQIDISWATATDAGVGLQGYQVFRDNFQIATTSNTYYNDTGLMASTTYEYNITAFDIFLNISARSATSSTTTLPNSVATTSPTTTPDTSGAAGEQDELQEVLLAIEEVEVETTNNSAEISFFTAGFSVASISYGETPQYDLGSSASDVYRKRHRFPLFDLNPGVRYYFKLSAQNHRGDIVIYEGDFVTQTLVDTVPPANVSDFSVYIEGNDAVLNWKNPREEDFNRVRVVANDKTFPVDLADGYLLYEGTGQNYRHNGVYPEFSQMFYTVFAIDDNDNRSSGAISYVTWRSDVVEEKPYLEPDAVSSSTLDAKPEAISIDFSDIEFVQDASIHQGYQGMVSIDPFKQFTVRVPYESFPEHLKTITVSIMHPENTSLTYAFLLRVNESKTYYEATIEPLNLHGQFPLEIVVIDFKTARVVASQGTISTVPKTDQTYAEPIRSFGDHLLFLIFNFWWGWILILILLLFSYRLLRGEEPQRYGMG